MAKGAKILVVEDESNEREGLAELLRAWGYQTETAADGAEALEKIAAFSPAVILSDLRMPRLTGMELLRQLHESQSSEISKSSLARNGEKPPFRGEIHTRSSTWSEAAKPEPP